MCISTSVVKQEAVLCMQVYTAFHAAKLCVLVAVLATQLSFRILDQMSDIVEADITHRLSELPFPFVLCKQ